MDLSDPKSSEPICAEPAKSNTCAIIVAFFPDARFGERLDRISNQVAKTVVIDNTGDADPSAPSWSMDRHDIEVIRNQENTGVGEGLNQGLSRAAQLGYEWVITFDQDSWVDPELAKTLFAIYGQQPSRELVGIIGCNFEDENVHAPALQSPPDGPLFLETTTVITSGSLLCVATFTKVGPFRADFFIDFIDHEYCLRLLRLGYRVVISTAPLMVHALGTAVAFSLNSSLGRLSVVLTNRTPLRRYYMTRNALFVAKSYFTVAPWWVLRSLASVLGFALVKIPLEKNA